MKWYGEYLFSVSYFLKCLKNVATPFTLSCTIYLPAESESGPNKNTATISVSSAHLSFRSIGTAILDINLDIIEFKPNYTMDWLTLNPFMDAIKLMHVDIAS